MIKAVLFDLGDTLIVEESVGNKHLWQVVPQKVPHVDEVLCELNQRFKLGIVTNTVKSRRKHVITCLRKIGIDSYFDVIITSVDIGYRKPDERIFLAALKTLNVKPEEVMMVGNRISDISGANKLGMKTILFKWNNRYSERAVCPFEQPDYMIDSLEELLPILFNRSL